MAELERRRHIWEQAGHTALEMYGEERMPQIVDTALYIGGLLGNRGGDIHPLKLSLGGAAALESFGAEIFCQYRCVRLGKGAKPTAYTDKGSVAANYIVICGNAYLGDAVPELTERIMSVSSQILTTEVLGMELAEKMLLAGYCIEDCNFLLDYYRITADYRL